jgi:hypothetical protein
MTDLAEVLKIVGVKGPLGDPKAEQMAIACTQEPPLPEMETPVYYRSSKTPEQQRKSRSPS